MKTEIIAMTAIEAKAWKDKVKESAQNLRLILDDGYLHSVWIALGYADWTSCIKSLADEFELSERHMWRLHSANQIQNNLLTNWSVGNIIPESQLRPLASLEPDQQREAYQIAIDTAPDGKITAAHVQGVVDDLYGDDEDEIDDDEFDREQILEANRQGASIIVPSVYKHVSDDSYEWYTPSDYIEAARALMGGIDLDPASCDEAQEKIKADWFYTKADDGLSQEWGGRVWLNPPYCMPEIENFTGRAIDLYVSGDVSQAVILTNNSTDTAWFHRLLLSAGVVCLTRGRVKFWGPDGGAASGARQGQAIFYLGHDVDEFKNKFEKFGTVLVLA